MAIKVWFEKHSSSYFTFLKVMVGYDISLKSTLHAEKYTIQPNTEQCNLAVKFEVGYTDE
jgi:hypothetical protein